MGYYKVIFKHTQSLKLVNTYTYFGIPSPPTRVCTVSTAFIYLGQWLWIVR